MARSVDTDGAGDGEIEDAVDRAPIQTNGLSELMIAV